MSLTPVSSLATALHRGVAALALLALLTAAVPAPDAVRAQTAAVVVAQSPDIGQYLSDGSGRTLYIFSTDTPGESTCVVACAVAWPPSPAPTGALATPAGADGTLSVVMRPDGTGQLAYNGMPLYRFAGDQNPGDVNGLGAEAFGGTWTVATP